jgi:hypothetical protein
VVSPLLQEYFEAFDPVSVTPLPPVQNDVELDVIVGTGGLGFTTTTLEAVVLHPRGEVTVTIYVPLAVGLIVGEEPPVLHK